MPSRFARLITELRARPPPRDGEAALARLRAVKAGKYVLEIGEQPEGRPLAELLDDEVPHVRLAPGVYAHLPSREARATLLRLARTAATETVLLHVAVGDDQSHLGRAFIDAPRALLRAARLPVAEPGDRFGPGRYLHCFFDEEELLSEFDQAGLAVTRRKGFLFTLAATDPAEQRAAEEADSFALEVTRVTGVVRTVDAARKGETPERALAAMRARGLSTQRSRGPVGRARLRRAIGWVDALRGASCYRRILLESALDAGAARETVVFGLDVGRTGHVAFEDREERTFDVSFAIPG